MARPSEQRIINALKVLDTANIVKKGCLRKLCSVIIRALLRPSQLRSVAVLQCALFDEVLHVAVRTFNVKARSEHGMFDQARVGQCLRNRGTAEITR
jgi:hypothetical protein